MTPFINIQYYSNSPKLSTIVITISYPPKYTTLGESDTHLAKFLMSPSSKRWRFILINFSLNLKLKCQYKIQYSSNFSIQLLHFKKKYYYFYCTETKVVQFHMLVYWWEHYKLFWTVQIQSNLSYQQIGIQESLQLLHFLTFLWKL